jgi:hypothetical protein
MRERAAGVQYENHWLSCGVVQVTGLAFLARGQEAIRRVMKSSNFLKKLNEDVISAPRDHILIESSTLRGDT